MNRNLIVTLAAFAAATASIVAPAAAGEESRPLGVVELFTSQGCSSCPPADAVLADLVSQGNVIALAYHVDYWDYLGWRDTLANAENTARQYDYGKSFAASSVYTPQAVINGRVHVNGADKVSVTGKLKHLAAAGQGMSVDIKVSRVGESFMIDAGAASDANAKAHLVLVYFDAKKPVVIERGENSGKTVTYWNAVSDVQAAGMWHGVAARFELPASEILKKEGCAALLQAVDANGLPGPILGAALVHGSATPTP